MINLAAYTIQDEIKRKALAGIPLSNTSSKTNVDLYNSIKSTAANNTANAVNSAGNIFGGAIGGLVGGTLQSGFSNMSNAINQSVSNSKTNSSPVVTSGDQKPQYNGMGYDEYKNTLLNKIKSDVNMSADTQISTINKNLADILGQIDIQKNAVQPEFDKTIQDIGNQEFNTKESEKELMNQFGWNSGNSGLAIGELNKVKISADKARSDTETQKALKLSDIADRVAQANNRASLDRQDIENWKSQKLSGAEADAIMASEDRNYSMYRDTVGDYTDLRNYNRGVTESDRSYNRDATESDRTYNYQVERDKVEDLRYKDELIWSRSENNPAYRAQILDNKISELNLKYLPQQLQSDLEQTRESIRAAKTKAENGGLSELEQAELNSKMVGYNEKINDYTKQTNKQKTLSEIGNLTVDGAIKELRSNAGKKYIPAMGDKYYLDVLNFLNKLKESDSGGKKVNSINIAGLDLQLND